MHRKIQGEVVKKMIYLKTEKKFVAVDFLREQEMIELYSFNKQAFNWKQGRYEVTIEMNSPELFTVFDNKLEFRLSSIDIDELEKNKSNIELSYERDVVGTKAKDSHIDWQWRNPELTKI